MNLKYRCTVNCTLHFDISADDEDHAQEIANHIAEELSGKSLKELDRGLVNPTIEIDDCYPEVHEN